MSKAELYERADYKCQECGLGTEWNGKPLTLQIHDHRTDNPIVLCPNCHTQTDSYCGKDRSKGKPRWNNGVKATEEHRRKNSEAVKKRWADPVYKARMIEKFKNRIPMTDEHKKKISEATKRYHAERRAA